MSAKHLKQCTSVLPQDIIQVILLKLPAKSLLRFKAVSRSWYTTISDPVFVQTHLCFSLSEWHSFAKSEDRKPPSVKLLEGPIGEHDVMCFCGGVLLLTEAKILFKRIVLWNPLSRTETHIWSPDICVGHHRQSYGLCYDPTSHDFKVVVMSPEYYIVFSSKNRFWTQRNKFPYSGELDSCASGVYANGAIYWVWRVWRHPKNVKEIMYFDPRDDKLKMLQKPKDTFVDDDESKLFYLVNLRGCLCLYYCDGGDSNEVRIWTKEKGIDKNCWNQSITVENVDNRIWWFKPHCLADNKIVIRFKDSTRFAFYSPFKNTFEESQCDTSYFGYEFVPYVHGVFFPTRKARPNKRNIVCM